MFAAPPTVPVSTKESVESRTNLIVDNGLLQVLEKPGYVFIVLNVISKQQQLPLDTLEFAGKRSALHIMRNNSVPSQFVPAHLLWHIIWARIETFFHCSYIRKKDLSLIFHSDGSLKIVFVREGF